MPSASPRLLVPLLVLLALALPLTAAAAANDRFAGDLWLTEHVQQWDWAGGAVADAVRAITTTPVVVGTGVAAAALLFVFGPRRQALVLLALMLVLSLLQAALKEVVDRPRPPADLVGLRASATSESFPAGHVMSPTALYGYLLLLSLRRELPTMLDRIRWPIMTATVALLALTGVVQVHLGVHWPSDVIGGYVWGAALALAGAVVLDAWRRRSA